MGKVDLMSHWDLDACSGEQMIGTVNEDPNLCPLGARAARLGPEMDCTLECRQVDGQWELFIVWPDLTELQLKGLS